MKYLTLTYSKPQQAWVLAYSGRVLGVYSRKEDALAIARQLS
jgi:hypothetical protein